MKKYKIEWGYLFWDVLFTLMTIIAVVLLIDTIYLLIDSYINPNSILL